MSTTSLTGRVGNVDPVRKTQSGKSVLGFSVADNYGFGENKKTQWVKCSLWGDRAEKLAPFIAKGNLVEVIGQLFSETWTDSKTSEARASLKMNVNDIKLHGGGEKKDNAAETPENDFVDEIPF